MAALYPGTSDLRNLRPDRNIHYKSGLLPATIHAGPPYVSLVLMPATNNIIITYLAHRLNRKRIIFFSLGR